MGYYTSYKLDMQPHCPELYERICQGWPEFRYALHTKKSRWYGHEDDMLSISASFPEILFILSGEGEEGGDLWKKYFHRGLMQKTLAKITYEDFDESKLGPPQAYIYRDGQWRDVDKVWNERQQRWENPPPKLKKGSRRDPDGEYPIDNYKELLD